MSFHNSTKMPFVKTQGWGRYPIVDSTMHESNTRNDAKKIIEYTSNSSNGIIPQGMGRSYGDSSLASNIVSIKRLNRILEFDSEKRILHAEAGITFENLLNFLIPRGFFLPVTPGTKYITLAGAVASDVHGKNHHLDGSFCDHVISMELLTANLKYLILTSNGPNSEIFRATCGGMGLTGIITSVKFKLKKIETTFITQYSNRAKDIDDIMQKFEVSEKALYSVAWIDCLAKGKKLGRSILITGDHTSFGRLHDMRKKRDSFLQYNAKPKLNIPINIPSYMLNPFSIKAFNFLYYHKSKDSHKPFLSRIDPFFYPLDSINNWNRMYGKKGFLQYQFVLPEKNSRSGMIEVLEKISASGYGSFLAVLKKFGRGNANYLSFPSPGYTLALDFPVKKKVFHLLRELDEIVLKYGGHLYLTKDARMDQEFFQKTQANLKKFLEIKRRMDPNGIFSSHQSQRLL